MVVGGIQGETKGILSAIIPPAARPVFSLSSSNEPIKENSGGATHLVCSVPHVNLLSESGRQSKGLFFPLPMWNKLLASRVNEQQLQPAISNPAHRLSAESLCRTHQPRLHFVHSEEKPVG